MKQRILVFQQHGSGESKIEGLRKYGNNEFLIQTRSIEDDLPILIDDTSQLLPQSLEADLVLDFLIHPDLSYDLAALCKDQGIPLVASGKKSPFDSVVTPPV
jgi:hypothetical protein